MNTRSVVESDLAAFAGDADAFAIENPVEDSLADAIRVNLSVPIVTIGLTLFALLVQLPLFLLVHRDIVQVELLALDSVSGDRPTHHVDRHPVSLLAGRGWPWIVGNWLVFGALLYLLPVSTLLLAGLVVVSVVVQTVRRRYGYRYVCSAVVAATIAGLVWTVVAGHVNPVVVLALVVVAMVVVRGTIGERDEVMTAEVAALAEEHDYDEVCLLTGNMHVTGMLEIAPSHGLSVTAAFKQLWRQPGRRLGTDWEPADYGALTEAEGQLGQRGLARVLDWMVVGGGGVILPVIVATVADIEWGSVVLSGIPVTYTHLLALWLFAVPVAYYTAAESLFDRTVGKRVADVAVRQYDGTEISGVNAFLRALFGWVDFLPISYVFGAIAIGSDEYGRRIGDKIAGTVVVPEDASVEVPATRPAGRPVSDTPLSGPEAPDEAGNAGDATHEGELVDESEPGGVDQLHADQTDQDEDDHTDADHADQLEEPLLAHTDGALGARIKARLVDWVVVGVLIAGWVFAELLAMALYQVSSGVEVDFGAPVLAGTGLEVGHVWLLSLLVPATVYYTVTEGVWGQTVGKRFADLRVVHTDGSTPGLRSAFVRTMVGWIDALPLGFFLGGVVAFDRDYGRRVGDLAAGTVVVKREVASKYATDVAHTEWEGTTDPRTESGHDKVPTAEDDASAERDTTGRPPAGSPTAGDQSGTEGETTGVTTATGPDDEAVEGGQDPEDTKDRGTDHSSGSRADEEWTAAILDDEE